MLGQEWVALNQSTKNAQGWLAWMHQQPAAVASARKCQCCCCCCCFVAKCSLALQEVVRHLLDEGMLGAAQLQQQHGAAVQQYRGGSSSSSASWGLMYSWHGKRYLGAAHGEERHGAADEAVNAEDAQQHALRLLCLHMFAAVHNLVHQDGYSGSLLCSSLSRHVLTMCSFGVARNI
jgi:hypothetical protein